MPGNVAIRAMPTVLLPTPFHSFFYSAHLPQTLATIAFDRVKEKVPEQYIKNAISSSLASKIVYKEGTKFIDSLPAEKLAEIALRYIEKESEVANLINVLTEASVPAKEKQAILDLLAAGGARTALRL